MSERLAALRELLENPASNPSALGAAIAIVVLIVILIALILIVLALPDRDEDNETPEGELPARRKRPTPFLSALAAWMLAVTTLGVGVLIFYESTSSNEYCTQTCHAMAKPSATHAASAHKSISCVRCHEGRKWDSMWTGLGARANSIYLQYSAAESNGANVPESRCLECHRTAMRIELTARNGEQFTHTDLPNNGSGCSRCHGDQGHEIPVLR